MNAFGAGNGSIVGPGAGNGSMVGFGGGKGSIVGLGAGKDGLLLAEELLLREDFDSAEVLRPLLR